MTWLLLGLALWVLAHLFKRLAPGARAGLERALGPAAKGLVAAGVLAGLVLMVLGYRAAEFRPVYDPPAWGIHLTNLLMIAAVGLFGLAHSKSRLRARLRHPMLTAVIVWALAHLLVNGDLASLLLFGGLGLWAVISILLINAREPRWTPFAGGSAAGDLRLAAITVAGYAVIAAVHTWLGYWPFPG